MVVGNTPTQRVGLTNRSNVLSIAQSEEFLKTVCNTVNVRLTTPWAAPATIAVFIAATPPCSAVTIVRSAGAQDQAVPGLSVRPRRLDRISHLVDELSFIVIQKHRSIAVTQLKVTQLTVRVHAPILATIPTPCQNAILVRTDSARELNSEVRTVL